MPDPIDGGVDPDSEVPIACIDGCPAGMPVCDVASSTCRRCVADADCPGACHELAGTCTTVAQTIYVSAMGADNATCSEASPCASLGAAIGVASPMRRMIRIEDGTYAQAFSLRNDAILSGPDLDPAGVQITANPGGGSNQADSQTTSVIEGVTIAAPNNEGIVNRGTLTLSHVTITNAQRHGIDNRGGTLIVRDSRIVGSDLNGITSNSTLDVQRTHVLDSKTGGINSTGTATIINCVIANNGSTQPQFGGARLGGSMNVFRFNTLARNGAPAGGVAGVECNTPVTIESSIFANAGGFFTSEINGMCSARYSLFSSNAPAGMGNVTGAPMFVNAMSDHHLIAGSPAIDKADPASTESLDFEGGGRPTGVARDIGADEQP